MLQRSGAQVLVDQLSLHGVDTIFCVPGESFLSVLDALYERRSVMRLITTRQEGGAANMAEAYGKLTGHPGICFVTRGPGATNASIGVHTAFQDSTPMLLFIGQVPQSQLGRDAFQEVDYRQMFASLAKWVVQIEDARRIPELIGRAFQVATSGRPGPVVIALPEDMQDERVAVADGRPYQRIKAAPAPTDMHSLTTMLNRAERPLVIVGREGWSLEGIRDLRAFIGAAQLPTVTVVRAQDQIDNRAPEYVGYLGLGANPTLIASIREADFLLVIGVRLDGLSTASYTLIDIPRPQQAMAHVYPDSAELGRIYQADLLINASLPEFAASLRTLPPLNGERWATWRSRLREAYVAYSQPVPSLSAVNMAEVVDHVRRQLPADGIITIGAGNYTAWVHRFSQFTTPRTLLGPMSGAMGYGVPAAVAAKVVYPDRAVVCFAGDGCFLMTGQELATAVRYGLNVIFIVVNNSTYGTIRMHQEREFPGRVHGTDLTNPNFADYARAFGAQGEVVERTEEFAAAFERALHAHRPALIEVRTDPDEILPGRRLRH